MRHSKFNKEAFGKFKTAINFYSDVRLKPIISRCSNLKMKVMQSYLLRALDTRLYEDWARDAREGPRVRMSLREDFGTMG